ncbi:VOC family protein [Sphingopyxis kveilinensis]|uniref:VOC family protein n=1 Tax=Sphingopyxis kveilinensis TaxID=3114367 RepID=UPI003BB0FE85
MVMLDHLILEVADANLAADFLCDVVGLERAAPQPPFQVVRAGETSIDLLPTRGAIEPRHLAFRIGSEAFDELLARLCARGQMFWSDPFHRHPDAVYRTGDVRGIYFDGPSGHRLEVLAPLPLNDCTAPGRSAATI